MRFILRAAVLLTIFAVIGLAAYAYLGNLSPPQTEVTLPVVLDAE